MNKKQLYESIISSVAKEVKKALNEDYVNDIQVGSIFYGQEKAAYIYRYYKFEVANIEGNKVLLNRTYIGKGNENRPVFYYDEHPASDVVTSIKAIENGKVIYKRRVDNIDLTTTYKIFNNCKPYKETMLDAFNTILY